MRPDSPCARSEDAAAFVGDELTDAEREAFARHLAQCESCARAVESTRGLFSILRAVPEVKVSRDLTGAILDRIHEEPARPVWWPRVAGMAAAAAVVVLVGFAQPWRTARPALGAVADSPQATPTTQASVERALDWLCKAQEPSGAWSAQRWGGDRRFEIALTALPLMALLHDEHSNPERSAAMAKAVEQLRREQAANGSFGGEFFGACYNQGIATLALLHAYQARPTAELKGSLDKALTVILGTQTAAGGWGYFNSPQPQPTITLWNVEALKLAAQLGWRDARSSAERGTEWMQHHGSLSENAEGLADVDFYSAYFLASVLRQADDAASRDRLNAIRRTLVARQVQGGSDSGSWAPDEQWGRVGGRLYSTALASLSLR